MQGRVRLDASGLLQPIRSSRKFGVWRANPCKGRAESGAELRGSEAEQSGLWIKDRLHFQ